MTRTSRESERRERFRSIYEANYVAILGYALRRVPADDAADVVAETFLVAWRRLEEVPEEARLWLYGTARRVLANQARAAGRRKQLVHRLRGEARREGDLDPAEQKAAGAVAAAFGRLSGEERELLALVAWEGLGAGQIAHVLGCSTNAVRIRLHRARRKLAHELERDQTTNRSTRPRQVPGETSA